MPEPGRGGSRRARARGRLVVLGDALLDADLVGRAGRLCPDAPVPVLDDLVEHERPGGAALAAVLAAREDREVVLVTALADDEPARRLAAAVEGAGVRLVALPHDGSTPVKRRVRAEGQSLLRLDSGVTGRIGELPERLQEQVRAELDGAAAVLVSDYGRGLAGHPVLRRLLTSRPDGVPLVWDPHPSGSLPVRGASLVTPNEAEAVGYARPDAGGGLRAVSGVAAELVGRWEVHAVAVTRGAHGALLSRGESSPSVVPAPRVRAGDTCGAGDCFAAAAAAALADGAVTLEAVQDAVHAAARFVSEGGAAALTGAVGGAPDRAATAATEEMTRVDAVRAAGGTVVATGGCFDWLHAGHVSTLEQARTLGDCLVVCLNSDASVRRLKGSTRPLVPQEDRVRVLEALAAVDAVVVFDEDTPEEALRRLRPDIWVKGGDYAGAELPEARLLEQWGGQCVVLPYLEGRSTTGLLTAASRERGDTGVEQTV